MADITDKQRARIDRMLCSIDRHLGIALKACVDSVNYAGLETGIRANEREARAIASIEAAMEEIRRVAGVGGAAAGPITPKVRTEKGCRVVHEEVVRRAGDGRFAAWVGDGFRIDRVATSVYGWPTRWRAVVGERLGKRRLTLGEAVEEAKAMRAEQAAGASRG